MKSMAQVAKQQLRIARRYPLNQPRHRQQRSHLTSMARATACWSDRFRRVPCRWSQDLQQPPSNPLLRPLVIWTATAPTPHRPNCRQRTSSCARLGMRSASTPRPYQTRCTRIRIIEAHAQIIQVGCARVGWCVCRTILGWRLPSNQCTSVRVRMLTIDECTCIAAGQR